MTRALLIIMMPITVGLSSGCTEQDRREEKMIRIVTKTGTMRYSTATRIQEKMVPLPVLYVDQPEFHEAISYAREGEEAIAVEQIAGTPLMRVWTEQGNVKWLEDFLSKHR